MGFVWASEGCSSGLEGNDEVVSLGGFVMLHRVGSIERRLRRKSSRYVRLVIGELVSVLLISLLSTAYTVFSRSLCDVGVV